MAKIRELQPAHKSDKVTVDEAARAFRKVQERRRRELVEPSTHGNGHIRRDEEVRSPQHATEDDRLPVSSNGGKP